MRDEVYDHMDEEEVVHEIQEVSVPPADEILSPVSILTEENLKKMKVVELRLLLRDRGLIQNGNKQELVARIIEAIKNDVPVVQNMSQEMRESLVCNSVFPVGTHWTLLEADDDVVDESDMFVEGIQFRGPTDNEVIDENEVGQRLSRGDPIRLSKRKRNYSSHVFDRPPFVRFPVLMPERIRNSGKFKRIKTNNGSFGFRYSMSHEVKEATVPNIEFILENNLCLDSHPAEWFHPWLPLNRKIALTLRW